MIDSDPNATITLTLPRLAEAPEGERPLFVFRYFTSAECKELRRLSDAADDRGNTIGDAEAAVDALAEWLDAKLVRVENAGAEVSSLAEAVGPSDICELGTGLRAAALLGPDEKKDSEPQPSEQPPSGDATGAGDAAAAPDEAPRSNSTAGTATEPDATGAAPEASSSSTDAPGS